MDTQAMRWFQMVADGHTLTEVADIEMMSQPGISRALTRLEKEVGTPLLRRSGRILTPTPAGEVFQRHVKHMLRHLEEAVSEIGQLIDPETGTVSFAFQPSLGTWLLPDLVGSFHAKHPGVTFDMRAKGDERISAVGPGSAVDLEISTLPVSNGGRVWYPLVTEPLRLLLPGGHRLAGQRQASLADVRHDPFVTLRETSLLRSQLDELCATAGFEPNLEFIADDLPTLRGYVASGLGVAILPARWYAGAVEPMSPRVHYLELTDPGAERTVGLAWHQERRMLPATQLFRRHVIDRARAGELPDPVPIP